MVFFFGRDGGRKREGFERVGDGVKEYST